MSRTNEHIQADQLKAFAAGNVQAESATSIEQHLLGCAQCADAVGGVSLGRDSFVVALRNLRASESVLAEGQSVAPPSSVWIDVFDGEKYLAGFTLETLTEFGRQTSAERIYHVWRSTADGQRFVLSPRFHHHISRVHLLLLPSTEGRVTVVNSSRKCLIEVNSSKELQPGSRARLRPPVRVAFCSYRILMRPIARRGQRS